jgi:hypothetical protein
MPRETVEYGKRRETRLLVLVVVVSLAVLLLLARFRFPASDIAVVAPTPGPLAGLAARAAFDDMSGTVRNLLGQISPFLMSIVLEANPTSDRARGRNAAGQGAAPERQLVAALLVRRDIALVPVPAGFRPVAGPGVAEAVVVAALDPTREIALLEVDAAPGWSELRVAGADGLQYVGAFSATPGGISVQPLFLGRVDLQPDERWHAPVLLLGSVVPPPPGLFLFSIDGRWLGLTARHVSGTALIQASTIEEAVTALLAARGTS